MAQTYNCLCSSLPTSSPVDFFLASAGFKAGSLSLGKVGHELDMYRNTKIGSDFLRSSGVPESQIREIVSSFERGTIDVRAAGSAQYGLRYFDNVAARPEGRYLFETFPATRDSLALMPEWNKMTGIKQWQVREGTQILGGRAASQGFYGGGQTQMFVPALSNLLEPK